MISKHGDYKNGYIFTKSSTDKDLQTIYKNYDRVNCIICNSNTAKNFDTRWNNGKGLVINEKINDGCFFINGCY